jgi:protein-tyrosine phosphatase
MSRVLFVCLGNICRSASAETIFREKVKAAGLSSLHSCDSAGTSNYHVGELADSRMRRHAAMRDLELTSIARQLRTPEDFEEFDLLVAMDSQNLADLKHLARDAQQQSKLVKMTDFCTDFDVNDVPDPYYGGEQGFEEVLDILDDACDGLLQHLQTS